MNDHRAIIVGICEASRTFQSNPVVYTTYSRAKGLRIPMERKVLSRTSWPRSEPGRDPKDVARRIDGPGGPPRPASMGPDRRRLRSGRRSIITSNTPGIPINFGITAILGFLVGTAIAGQTFYNFTLENLKQFGALKAMGATNGRIVQMILLQAMVVGFLGYGIGVGLAALFGELDQERRAGVLHPLATPADHRGGRGPDLHPGQPPERPEGARPGTGGRLPGLIPPSSVDREPGSMNTALTTNLNKSSGTASKAGWPSESTGSRSTSAPASGGSRRSTPFLGTSTPGR